MINQQQLKDLFNYSDGDLYWRVSLNRRIRVGDRAGTMNSRNYRQVIIGGKHYQEHRLVYLLHHGYLPEYLDHINGIRNDNRIENLRPCTLQQNQYNSKGYGTSGVKGVNWNKRDNRWQARISIDGKQRSLGYFSDINAAMAIVSIAREAHHGVFARYN